MDSKVLTRQANHTGKRTTLSPDHACDVCGEPAMTKEGDRLRCPSCWLKEKTKLVKNRIDRGGYYP